MITTDHIELFIHVNFYSNYSILVTNLISIIIEALQIPWKMGLSANVVALNPIGESSSSPVYRHLEAIPHLQTDPYGGFQFMGVPLNHPFLDWDFPLNYPFSDWDFPFINHPFIDWFFMIKPSRFLGSPWPWWVTPLSSGSPNEASNIDRFKIWAHFFAPVPLEADPWPG